MSLLVIGELGEVLKVEQTFELKKYIDNYNKKMNLESNDIYIIDKNGKTIYPNSLAEINYDSKFFIFNRIFYKDKLLKLYEESIEKISYTYTSMNPNNYLPNSLVLMNESYDYYGTLFELNSTIFEKNGIQLNEIKFIFDFFQECNESIKKCFLNYKIENKICEKTRDNYNFQYNSLECIYKNISILYEQCFTKYKDLENELISMKESNGKILHTYRASIEKLKTIEIHPKMQNKNDTYLIDIYFDESKMNVWKEKCTKSSDFISNKIKSKSDIIAGEKNKIRNEKNSNILTLKEDWNTIISEYESFINEKENSTQFIVTNLSEEIKKFKKLLNALRESILNQNSGSSMINLDEYFDEIKLYKTRIPNIKNLLISYQANIEALGEFAVKMKNLLTKSTVSINLVFTNYHTIKKNLLEIIEKLDKYSEGIKNLEKDFSYLLNPSQFPDAYNSSLIEIKRRIIFNKKIAKDFERLKHLVGKENSNRKQFIQDYGKYLTHDYVPQLKFSDLELKIDLNNQDEMLNLPNILDEEEENTISNYNIYLDYEDISPINCESNFIMANNLNKQSSNITNRNEDAGLRGVKSIRKNSNSDDNRKGDDFNINNSEEFIRNLNLKISEYEIMLKVKESEIKKLYSKIDQKERKITFMHSEIDKLSNNIDAINENYLKQLNFKDQKIRDKNLQCENLMKIVNNMTGDKLENCPVCKDVALNNIDYQGWGNYVKDYHEKIIEKNKLMSKLESRYNELVIQTNLIKKTFFSHVNSTVELKNREISSIKENYENKLMNIEDLLSQEKNRIEKFIAKENLNSNGNNNSDSLEEQIKSKDLLITQIESRNRDLSKQLENLISVNKQISAEKENLKKTNDDMKVKENSLIVDVKMKDSKIDAFKNDIKNLEKIIETQKKSISQINEEILLKIKENTNLKYSLELKSKNLEELEKSLESLKTNHIETINEIYKSNQISVDKLNLKLDELTQQLNEKFIVIEEHKLKNQELIMLIEKKNEEIKQLKENIERVSKSQQELDILRDKMEHLESFNTNENYKLKRKLDEMQTTLMEKEKKLQDFNELTKLFATTDIYFKTTANTNSDTTFNKTLSVAFSNLNINNALTKCLDFEEFVNVKRLEKGSKSIFVPHSAGVYVSIALTSLINESHTTSTTNFESNFEHNKYFKCNAILNLNSFDNELKDLLIENSLIIIGKIGKLNEIYITSDNNEFGLPEENNYIFVDLEKIDFIIGFQGEEMIFRNYLF